MASIQRRVSKDGEESFRVGYRQHGKLRWTKTFEDGAGAVEAKGLIERLGPDAALAIIGQRHGRSTTDAPLLRDWLAQHLERLGASATPGTVADYRRMAERTWLPALGALHIDAVTRDAVTSWVAWQRQQPTATQPKGAREVRTYSPKSIANAQRFLSSVMQAAVDRDLIPKNPARGVALPSDHERGEMTFLTESEFVRIYEQIPDHYKPFVLLLAGTGMRWGEATALQPGDFDLDAEMPVVRVVRAWKKGEAGVYLGSPKSKRGRRAVSIGRDLVAAVRELVESTADGDLVFTAREGGRIRAQNFHPRVWHPAVERSGVGKSPRLHDLRHSHAAWQIARRTSLTVLQRRLGHESIKTTSDVYGHIMPDALAESAVVADLALAGAMPQVLPQIES